LIAVSTIGGCLAVISTGCPFGSGMKSGSSFAGEAFAPDPAPGVAQVLDIGLVEVLASSFGAGAGICTALFLFSSFCMRLFSIP
jgi:hypothetical protein